MPDIYEIAPIIIIAAIIAIIILIVMCKKKSKDLHSKCPNCKQYYFYDDDIKVEIGDLKWEKRQKEETHGDFTYDVTYKRYYRILTFGCKCSKCGQVKAYSKRVDIYDSDSKYSQSDEEEIEIIESAIRKFFVPCVFDKKLREQKNSKQ